MTPEELARVKKLEWARDDERLSIASDLLSKIKPESLEEEKELLAARTGIWRMMELLGRRP